MRAAQPMLSPEVAVVAVAAWVCDLGLTEGGICASGLAAVGAEAGLPEGAAGGRAMAAFDAAADARRAARRRAADWRARRERSIAASISARSV